MPDRRMIVLAAIALIAVLLFLTVGLRGNVQFVLQLRALKLLALLQVAISIAVSTVLFQTVTANRILTPSIMGLDALYLFGQTALIFALGGFGYASLDAGTKFGAEVLLMISLAGALLWPLIRTRMDMNLMLLMGVTLGLLFRSLSQLLSRLLDPNAFAIVQTASFANFNMLRADLTILGTIITLAAAVVSWRARHVLDIVGLGREAAIGLGVSWIRTAAGLLLLVAILVAVSTALVGPVVFFRPACRRAGRTRDAHTAPCAASACSGADCDHHSRRGADLIATRAGRRIDAWGGDRIRRRSRLPCPAFP